jgi:hypothetical protein
MVVPGLAEAVSERDVLVILVHMPMQYLLLVAG